MQFDIEHRHARLELRVLELEDTVAAMTTILGTMTEMMGKLNTIAAHYAETIAETVTAIPHSARQMLPMWPTEATPYKPCGDCTGGRCGATEGPEPSES